jgi:hypothetical protein
MAMIVGAPARWVAARCPWSLDDCSIPINAGQKAPSGLAMYVQVALCSMPRSGPGISWCGSGTWEGVSWRLAAQTSVKKERVTYSMATARALPAPAGCGQGSGAG